MIKSGTGTLTLTGANTYTGGTTIAAGTLVLDGSSAAGTGTISFQADAQALRLTAGGTLSNTVAGFATDGDIIDVRGIGTDAKARFDYGTSTLTLTDAAGTTTKATIQLSGSYAGQVFSTASDGMGGTQVSVAAVTLAITVALANDSGRLSSDGITNVATVTGIANPGATVELKDGARLLGSTTADASTGQYTIVPTSLSDGTHTLTATETFAGLTKDASVTFTLDTTPASAPVGTAPANGAVINTARPTITGTAEAGSTVRITIDGAEVGTTTATSGGVFSFTSSVDLGQGAHTVRSTATDAAGNTGPSSATNTFTVDTVAPTLAITSNASTLKSGQTATVTFTFSEDPASSFTSGDVTVSGGTLSAISGSSYAGDWVTTVS